MATNQDIQFEAMGDPTRRAILARLRKGPMPVSRLAEGFTISRPAISQHLRVLKEAKLVRDQAEGTRRLYSLDPRGFEAMRMYFDRMWGSALETFKAHLEEER